MTMVQVERVEAGRSRKVPKPFRALGKRLRNATAPVVFPTTAEPVTEAPSSALPVDIDEHEIPTMLDMIDDVQLQAPLSEEASSVLSAVSAELTPAQRAVIQAEVQRYDANRQDKLAELHSAILNDEFRLHLCTKNGRKYSLNGANWRK